MPKGPFTSQGRQSTLRQVIGARDARTDLGYGTLKAKFHSPRSLGSEFPYYEKEDEDDISDDIDQDTSDAVKTKYSKYQPSDFNRAAGNDPFYFAAGNTSYFSGGGLADCFFRTDAVLQEIAAFSNSMAPIPSKKLYPGASSGLSGGPFLPGSGKSGGNALRTGTYYGTSHAPKPVLTDEISEEEEERDESEHIFTLKDLARKISIKNGEKV